MQVTQITFDPRVDLPGGGTTPLAVTIKATPIRIRDDGNSTIYPTNVTYVDVTAATPFALNSTDGTWAWAIGVYDTSAQRARLLDARTVAVTGATATWPQLTEVDPDTLTADDPDPAWWAAIGTKIDAVALTQTAYDAIPTKDTRTLYLITT